MTGRPIINGDIDAIIKAFKGLDNEDFVKKVMQAVKIAYKRTPERHDYIKLGDESQEIMDLMDVSSTLIVFS